MRSWMLGVALVVAATPAIADDTAKARKLYDEGLRHYQVAEYPQAIDAWKQSYLLAKKPLLLFNIGQAYRLSGDCKQALTFYDNYQDAEPSPKNQDELDQAIAACKSQPDKPATGPATPPPPTTPPPTTTTTTTNPAAPVETPPVETAPPATPPVTTAPAEPPPPAAAPAPSASGGGHRTLAIGLTVAGGLLEAGAVVFAIDGRSKSNDVADATVWNQHTKDLQAAGVRDNRLAYGLGIAGAAALVTGVVLIVTGHPSTESGVAIVPTRDGARVGWSHSF